MEAATEVETTGLLGKILPTRFEDVGLEDRALPPDPSPEAILKAANAVRSIRAKLLYAADEDTDEETDEVAEGKIVGDYDILPPSIEDAGLEDSALEPESIHQAFLTAASAIRAVFDEEMDEESFIDMKKEMESSDPVRVAIDSEVDVKDGKKDCLGGEGVNGSGIEEKDKLKAEWEEHLKESRRILAKGFP